VRPRSSNQLICKVWLSFHRHRVRESEVASHIDRSFVRN
jgi:hypothetical protein